MGKKAFLLFLLLISKLMIYADGQADFEKANKAYMAGFYENAITIYEDILARGQAAPELYYNLGNAYFKNDEISKAILSYERALKLKPGSEDFHHNLLIANNKRIDKMDTLPDFFYVKWWNAVKYEFSANQWARLSLISFTLIFIFVALFLLSRKAFFKRMVFYTAIVILLINILSGIMAWQTHTESIQKNTAIVFAPTLPVKSSPDESSIDLFVIHEGLKVQIIDKIGDWNEIKIENGSKGWVKAETLERI